MSPHRTVRAFLFVLFALAASFTAGVAFAEDPILTVGKAGSPEDKVVFDRAALEALPASVIVTSTIWTDGTHEFTGVYLSDLLAAVGAPNSAIRATALNDYGIDIPAEDAAPGAALIAYRMDGQPMSIREKGPLWIVYPYDTQPKYRTEVIYSRSIWQLDRIEVLD